MKNPLNKRLLRELKSDFAKYLVIFLFLVLLISLVSAFLVADYSVTASYYDGFTRYNVEDGHLSFSKVPDASLLRTLEERGHVTLYDLHYFEETNKSDNATIRVYKDRTEINLECLMDGAMPVSDDEIALDRMYAQNAKISIGDTITLNKKDLKVVGLIAVPDYSCLFEKNSDMMFDSVGFSIAVMTESGYNAVNSVHTTVNYGWKYTESYDRDDKVRAAKLSDDFLEVLIDVIRSYDEDLAATSIAAGNYDFENDLITVSDYLPRYQNQAINFTGEDMGSDKIMFTIFDYIVIVVIAFVFAVTTANTITAEAGVIGTLRASGYSRGQLVRHYMVLPIAVTLLAAVIGNVLGYTVLKQIMINMYYNSYSLATYETLWSAEAFRDTTVIPVLLMFVINLWVLCSKLKLSPLRFLRRDLSKRGKKKAFRLNTKIPFLHRFRLRILFQNIPNYITLFFGVFLGGCIVIFSLMFVPLLDDYADQVIETRLAEYQYLLTENAETTISGAEKFNITSLETTYADYKTDETMIYGISSGSTYVTQSIPSGKVLISNGMSEKYNLFSGDTFSLKDPYSTAVYEFTIADIYTYDAAIAVFMNLEEFNSMFGKASDDYAGYFSNTELTDLPDHVIAGVIDTEDLTKISNQLKISVGGFMDLLKYFGIVMFLLLMFLLSKQIIEKNSQSISMTKILGFTNGEISGLYIVATSVVVLLSLLITIPLVDLTLRWLFSSFLYKEISGYIPYIISSSCYTKMLVYGILCYIASAVVQMIKISRIPKVNALKNVE